MVTYSVEWGGVHITMRPHNAIEAWASPGTYITRDMGVRGALIAGGGGHIAPTPASVLTKSTSSYIHDRKDGLLVSVGRVQLFYAVSRT